MDRQRLANEIAQYGAVATIERLETELVWTKHRADCADCRPYADDLRPFCGHGVRLYDAYRAIAGAMPVATTP